MPSRDQRERLIVFSDCSTASYLARWRRCLDVAFVQVLVIFFARVLHDFPIVPEREDSLVGPGLGESLWIVDGHFIGHMHGVGTREALRHVQGIAMRMADGIQTRAAVKVDGVHN